MLVRRSLSWLVARARSDKPRPVESSERFLSDALPLQVGDRGNRLMPSEYGRRTEGGRKAFAPTNLAHLDVDCLGMKDHNPARVGGQVIGATGTAILLTLLLAVPAFAASDLNAVIDSVRDWVAGLLIALATLFLTVGGVRYLTAQGNPRAVEEAKAGIKAALIGYGLAALAPTLVSILQKVLRT